MQESFDRHSTQYGERVHNRERYGNLSLEDRLLADWLQRTFRDRPIGALIDAACGTGDRLRLFFEQSGIRREQFSSIVGLDYAPGMLRIAQQQRLEHQPLYTALQALDLTADISVVASQADLILCQWEVLNTCGTTAGQLLHNLSKLTCSGGHIVFDVLTTHAFLVLRSRQQALLQRRPDLSPHQDPQTIWYERDDQSVGYERLFTPDEIQVLLKTSGVQPVEVWSYNHRDLIPQAISLTESGIDTNQASHYNTLFCITQATSVQ